MKKLTFLQQEIVNILVKCDADYARPVNSKELGETLRVSPSYIREQVKDLLESKLISVRRGPGGGYFLNQRWKKMKVFIDGKEYKKGYSNDISKAFNELEKFVITSNKIIKEMKINGLPYDSVNLQEELKKTDAIIEIETQTPEELMLESMKTAVEYLPRLENGLKQVSELIQKGEDGEAISLFITSIDGLEWFGTILTHIDRWVVKGEKHSEEYNSKLRELLNAWENQDMVLISDILEYEICPFLNKSRIAIENFLEGEKNN